jgi:hypothetical protein
MPKKSAMTMGLEKILNSKDASPLNNPDVFRQIVRASGQPLSETLKYIGKKSKAPKPNDEEKSKARLEKLEAAAEENSK